MSLRVSFLIQVSLINAHLSLWQARRYTTVWNRWFMLRWDMLSESEVNGTRCGRSIWDWDEYWCIQPINSLDQTCHRGFCWGQIRSLWTVAQQMSYMNVHRCILWAGAISICKSFCLFYPSVPSWESICLTFLPSTFQTTFFPIYCVFLFSSSYLGYTECPSAHILPILPLSFSWTVLVSGAWCNSSPVFNSREDIRMSWIGKRPNTQK